MLPNPHPLAERLAPVAVQLVERIRTDHPMRLWRELVAPLDGPETAALIMLLAAAVDPSVHPDLWWGWVRYRDAIEHPSPIDYDDDPVPVNLMTSVQINRLVADLDSQGRSPRQIGDQVGMTSGAVYRRLERMRERDKAGVG